jgi:FMN phosphatase YigB (HAD superfamily)
MTSELPSAFVFDAYGTLFDVHSVAAVADEVAPGRGAELARAWRAKQLEYTWLSSLMLPRDGRGATSTTSLRARSTTLRPRSRSSSARAQAAVVRGLSHAHAVRRCA